jgi:hypothetical protein
VSFCQDSLLQALGSIELFRPYLLGYLQARSNHVQPHELLPIPLHQCSIIMSSHSRHLLIPLLHHVPENIMLCPYLPSRNLLAFLSIPTPKRRPILRVSSAPHDLSMIFVLFHDILLKSSKDKNYELPLLVPRSPVPPFYQYYSHALCVLFTPDFSMFMIVELQRRFGVVSSSFFALGLWLLICLLSFMYSPLVCVAAYRTLMMHVPHV